MCLVNAAWLFRQDFFRELTIGDVRNQLVKDAGWDEELLLPGPMTDGDDEPERLIDNSGIWERVAPEPYKIDKWSSTEEEYQALFNNPHQASDGAWMRQF